MQLGVHTGYQELAILPGRHASSLELARQAAPQFGLDALEAEAVIERIGDTVALQAAASVESAGGNRALTERVKDFIAQQATRIVA